MALSFGTGEERANLPSSSKAGKGSQADYRWPVIATSQSSTIATLMSDPAIVRMTSNWSSANSVTTDPLIDPLRIGQTLQAGAGSMRSQRRPYAPARCAAISRRGGARRVLGRDAVEKGFEVRANFGRGVFLDDQRRRGVPAKEGEQTCAKAVALDPGGDAAGHVDKSAAVGADRDDVCELPHMGAFAIVHERGGSIALRICGLTSLSRVSAVSG